MTHKKSAILGWILAAAAHAGVAHADLSQTVEFDIPPQTLQEALIKYSAQSHVQVTGPADIIDGKASIGVRGALPARNALSRLLEGTDLTYEVINENTVVIRRASLTNTATSSAAPPATSATETALALEEIIVSAQKREERAIDVPVSIVAMGADELKKRNVVRMDDLSLAVPGLSIQSQGGGWNRRITLRGVSNTFGAASLIGIYVDEAPATSGADLQLDLRTLDLERVEVLRGPQGTLYGEGSAGGTIRFITRAPQLQNASLQTDVTASLTEQGDSSQRVEMIANVPVVENVFGLRIAGTYDHQGGWIDQPAAAKTDFNDQETADVRVKGRWRPNDRFTADAMAIVHRANGSTSTGEDANGNYRQTFNLTSTPAIDDDYGIYNLTLTYDLPSVQVLSASSYIDQSREQRNYGYRLPSAAPPATPFDVLKPLYTRDAEFFTQELRVTSTGESRLRWTGGAFYRDSEIENLNTFYFALPGAPGSPLPALIRAPDRAKSESWAVFADTNYGLTGRLTLGVGLRYFHDDQEYDAGAPQERSFHALTPRGYAQIKLNDTANLYASASKGFRSGGFNRVAGRPTFDPESLWTYELGAKLALLDGRLRTDMAVFHSDYEDYQVNGRPASSPFSITSNAGKAEIDGVEASATWLPLNNWTIGLNGTYVDAEFVEIRAVGSSYLPGDPLDLFPDYNVGVSTQVDFDWLGRAAFARLDFSQQGRMNFRNRTSGDFYFSQSDVIDMLNVNFGLSWNESLSFGLFAQNLLNERGFVDPLVIEETAARARPRTVGLQFSATF